MNLNQTYIEDYYHANTGVCVSLTGMKSVINDVIDFYNQFDRYNHLTYVDLYQHISPSIRSGQHKVFQTNGEIWGFANWAFMSPDVLKKFTTTGRLHTLDWISGVQPVYVDFVANRNAKYVMKWLKNHSVTSFGVNTPLYWVRSSKHKVKRITKTNTKGYWKWDQ